MNLKRFTQIKIRQSFERSGVRGLWLSETRYRAVGAEATYLYTKFNRLIVRGRWSDKISGF